MIFITSLRWDSSDIFPMWHLIIFSRFGKQRQSNFYFQSSKEKRTGFLPSLLKCVLLQIVFSLLWEKQSHPVKSGIIFKLQSVLWTSHSNFSFYHLEVPSIFPFTENPLGLSLASKYVSIVIWSLSDTPSSYLYLANQSLSRIRP